MNNSDLNKAKELKELEEKILSSDSDLKIRDYITLYKDFYDGLRKLKNEYLEQPVNSFPTNSKDDEELLDYLQYILLEKDFTALTKKRLNILIQVLIQNLEDFSIDSLSEDFESYLTTSFDRLEGSVKNQLEELFSKDLEELDIKVEEKLVDDVFYNVHNPYSYIEALKKVGSLIVKSDSLPGNLSNVISTIKESYAFQQHLAVAAMCRTALEIVLRDIYKKLGFTTRKTPEHAIAKAYFDKMKHVNGKTYINQFDPSPRDLRFLICRLPEFEHFKEDLENIYADLSRVVHGTTTINKKRAEYYIEETFLIIHEMYLEIKSDPHI